LEFILPELLLLGLIKKWKVSDMVYEYVAKEGQLRVFWRNFTRIGAKGCAEAPQGCGGGELRDFVFGLPGDEFALKVCTSVSTDTAYE
jgi:hypothetical protein